MSEFQLYLSLGFHHICSVLAYDHILFISTLVMAFPLSQWKRVILILTAFTIGHSATLVLTAFSVFATGGIWIEILIACTILCTAIYNLIPKSNSLNMAFKEPLKTSIGNVTPCLKGGDTEISTGFLEVPFSQWIPYTIALCFGFIHGMGFGSQFHSLIASNTELIRALFAFNVGVELGQILVAGGLMLLLLILKAVKIPERPVRIAVSVIAVVSALIMIFQRVQNLH